MRDVRLVFALGGDGRKRGCGLGLVVGEGRLGEGLDDAELRGGLVRVLVDGEVDGPSVSRSPTLAGCDALWLSSVVPNGSYVGLEGPPLGELAPSSRLELRRPVSLVGGSSWMRSKREAMSLTLLPIRSLAVLLVV